MTSTRFIIIGAGFAGAATAWALSELGEGPGIILEREIAYGVHASGRNAGLLKISEDDALVRALAMRTATRLKRLEADEAELVRRTGGLSLGGAEAAPGLAALHSHMVQERAEVLMLTATQARRRHPILDGVTFEAALWCAGEGVIDVHALLTRYLLAARGAGFSFRSECEVEQLLVEGGEVRGVETRAGTIRAEVVIDATGAWAGRLGRHGRHLPLQPFRRHLFATGPVEGVTRSLPFVWVEDGGFYFRPEGDGLLMSPCDQTPSAPCLPSTDPAAAELLAEKLMRYAPGLADVSIRKNWACLRTFAPDRRPVIGPDPDLRGLFHVSGLGGFGVMTSAAVGELAAHVLTGRQPDWIDQTLLSPDRDAVGPAFHAP